MKQGKISGGRIFYVFYFSLILVYCVGMLLGLSWIRGWLEDFEAAQPAARSRQVFEALFADPDWAALYEASGAVDSPFEDREVFASCMEARLGDGELTCQETSAGLSGDRKYIVLLNGEKVASFILVDTNKAAAISELPDWQLEKIELYCDDENSFKIEMLEGHTAYVNGIALDDSYTVRTAVTLAESAGYLPEGISGPHLCTQQVNGLMAVPEVTILDEKGQAQEVLFDEGSGRFREVISENAITQEQQTAALDTAKAYCLWMIQVINSESTIARYFDSNSEIYKTIISTKYQRWMQNNLGYEFADETVSDFTAYSKELFSVRVSLSMNVTRINGSVKEYGYDQTLFFALQDGKWKAVEMTNVDISQPVTRVRLTFRDGEEILSDDFYDSVCEELTVPIPTPPEGKVFSGWVVEETGEQGKTVLRLIFQPEENGIVTLPSGRVLEPMTLYPLFEETA